MASPSPGVSRCCTHAYAEQMAVLPDADQQADRARNNRAARPERSRRRSSRRARRARYTGTGSDVPSRSLSRSVDAIGEQVVVVALARQHFVELCAAAARASRPRCASRVASCMTRDQPEREDRDGRQDHARRRHARRAGSVTRVSIDPRHGVAVDQRRGQVHQQHRERKTIRIAAPAADDPDEHADTGAIPEPAAVRSLPPTQDLSR